MPPKKPRKQRTPPDPSWLDGVQQDRRCGKGSYAKRVVAYKCVKGKKPPVQRRGPLYPANRYKLGDMAFGQDNRLYKIVKQRIWRPYPAKVTKTVNDETRAFYTYNSKNPRYDVEQALAELNREDEERRDETRKILEEVARRRDQAEKLAIAKKVFGTKKTTTPAKKSPPKAKKSPPKAKKSPPKNNVLAQLATKWSTTPTQGVRKFPKGKTTARGK